MAVPIIDSQSALPSSWQRTVSVPTLDGPFSFNLRPGSVVIIAGPNGTGKSALTHAAYKQVGAGDQAEFFPGHRQIFFSSEHYDFLQQPIEQLATNLFHNDAVAGRFRSAWSEDHLKSVLRRLSNDENQYNSDIAHAVLSKESDQLERFITRSGPLASVNAIFRAGLLPVSFKMEDGQIKAVLRTKTYNIDRMSDGERASLLIAAAVVVRKRNTVLTIDEPEKHLNPAISGALVSACIRARPDLGYLFSSHDLSFIE